MTAIGIAAFASLVVWLAVRYEQMLRHRRNVRRMRRLIERWPS